MDNVREGVRFQTPLSPGLLIVLPRTGWNQTEVKNSFEFVLSNSNKLKSNEFGRLSPANGSSENSVGFKAPIIEVVASTTYILVGCMSNNLIRFGPHSHCVVVRITEPYRTTAFSNRK